MQRHFGTFNERGMTDLRAIVQEWNSGDLSADRAMSAVADLFTDTFGSDVLDADWATWRVACPKCELAEAIEVLVFGANSNPRARIGVQDCNCMLSLAQRAAIRARVEMQAAGFRA